MDLPSEGYEDKTRVLLQSAMYGTRDAVHNRELVYNKMMIGAGSTSGVYSPCVFATRRFRSMCRRRKGWQHGLIDSERQPRGMKVKITDGLDGAR